MLSATGELVVQPRKSQEREGASTEAVKVGRRVRVRRKKRRRRGDMVEVSSARVGFLETRAFSNRSFLCAGSLNELMCICG